jgi:radical SAM superfamily enzyme YgiQ (UPF0313 family)
MEILKGGVIHSRVEGSKMRILLINPRLNSWTPNAYVPLGLASIASSLIEAGHDVSIIDLNVQKLSRKAWEHIIASYNVIGIGGMITEYQTVISLVHNIREINDKVTVILGGTLASTYPTELIKDSGANYIVIDEGEETIVKLLESISPEGNVKSIKGIAYIKNGEVIVNQSAEIIENLDKLPYPARNLLHMEDYIRDYMSSWGIRVKGFGKLRGTHIVTSRGCSYQCTFCSKVIWGSKWRARSAQDIMGEIVELNGRYGINEIIFSDDTFLLDKNRIFELCDSINKSGLKIAWYCNGRVNLVDSKLLEAMYSAGCRGIAYGIESGNQSILDSVRKGTTLEQIEKAVVLTKKAGINATGYFVIGMLGETKKNIEETFVFARKLKLDFHGFSIASPMPNTELYNQAIKQGLLDKGNKNIGEWSVSTNCNLTLDCSDSELKEYTHKAFVEFYLKKRFGNRYRLSPSYWYEGGKALCSALRNGNLRELINKVA